MDRVLSPELDYRAGDRAALVAAVADLVPGLAGGAAAWDEAAAFPAADIAALHRTGVLTAPLPERAGGLGLGTEPSGAATLADVLRMIGRGNMAVGRLYEAHVNAIALVARYGTAEQLSRVADIVLQGGLLALWVTDMADAPLVAGADGLLRGGKAVCSGAGHVGSAVVTAQDTAGGTRLAVLSTADAAVSPLPFGMAGMRAAVTGRVMFDGVRILPNDWVGKADDYMREPDFSCGAWRTCAVTCGGLDALVDLTVQRLVARGRADDPHQKARIGAAWIARETAGLWLARAASAAEEGDMPTADRVATVNFARIAIERCCLEAMTLVERSLGLAAFIQPDPVERIRRDLGTYLRQPAADEVLTEAAAHAMRSWTAAA